MYRLAVYELAPKEREKRWPPAHASTVNNNVKKLGKKKSVEKEGKRGIKIGETYIFFYFIGLEKMN